MKVWHSVEMTQKQLIINYDLSIFKTIVSILYSVSSLEAKTHSLKKV